MLKFDIKLNTPDAFNQIKLDETYLSPDMNFISGVTDYNYGLIDGQHFFVESNESCNMVECSSKIKNVRRQGYVIYDRHYPLEKYFSNGNEYRCVRYIDGKYYFSNPINGNNTITIEINGNQYTSSDNTIVIPTKYWVEDGVVEIDNIKYDIDFILVRKLEKNDENNTIIEKYVVSNKPYITLKNNKKLQVNNCDYNNWKYVTKIILYKEDNFKLNINYISSIGKKKYIEYNISNDKVVKYYAKYDSKSKKWYVEINGQKFFLENNDYVNINNEKIAIKESWVNKPNTPYLSLLTDNKNLNYSQGQRILVKSNDKIFTKCEQLISEDNNEYFSYCGHKFYKENDKIKYAILNNQEYKIEKSDYKWGMNSDKIEEAEEYGYIYVNFHNEPIPIYVNGEHYKIFSSDKQDKEEGNIHEYDYVIINNNSFIIKSFINKNNKTCKYIDVNLMEEYQLLIDEEKGDNLICHPYLNENDDLNSVVTSVVNNQARFSFYLCNDLFSNKNISKDGCFSEFTVGNTHDEINYFIDDSFITIPLSVLNDNSNNINQDDIVNTYFTENEIKESINEFVDMEREIYYPVFKINDNFKNINEIHFDLHFRTRDLNTWKIDDDLYKNTNSSNKKCNWNIFDYYTLNNNGDDDDRLLIDSNNTKYSEYKQPSDLLYFLNFTNDDIFYQKSKVGKSFLRLSFFNSNDPLNQSLLYTCTVFVDEGKLFKKYLDCLGNKNLFYQNIIPSKKDEDKIAHSISNQIGVNYEHIIDENNETLTFDDNKRLSASFIVKNRYDSNESAEGFYLYIFKEYCERLHEEPIYMKIEFNHAGEGRTVNMTIPYEISTKDGIETYRLLNLKDETDINIMKEGIPLKELYKHLYIPLESVYDYKNKRYCYYLPSWMIGENNKETSIMNFNLYEIKIKDES